MENTTIFENIRYNFLNSGLKNSCLSPLNNTCNYRHELMLKRKTGLLNKNKLANKSIKDYDLQSKICSECVWYKKK